MEVAIITSIITSVCSLIGVIITVIVGNRKKKTELEIYSKFQQSQIDEIKKQLKDHNDYANKIPVMQAELEFIRESVTDIKHNLEKQRP